MGRKKYLAKIRRGYWHKKRLLRDAKKDVRRGEKLLMKKIEVLEFAYKLEHVLPDKMSEIVQTIETGRYSEHSKVRKIKNKLKNNPYAVVNHTMKAIEKIQEVIIKKQVIIVQIKVVITTIVVEIRNCYGN